MPGRATNEPSNYIAIAVQSAKDVEGSNFYFLKHLEGSGFDVEDEVQREREGGDGQEIGFTYRSQSKGDGQLVANARVDWAGRALALIQGQDISSAVASGAILTRHTLIPSPTGPYFTTDQAWADEVERSTNDKMTQVEIEWEAGRPFKITGQFIAGGTVYERAAALTPARETGRPIMYPNASVVVTGADGGKMTKGKITVKRSLDDDIYTIGLNREDTVETAYDVDFEGTFKYENRTLYKRAKFGGGTQVPVDLATLGVDIFNSRGSHSLRMVAPGLEIADVKVNRLDPDGKTMYADVSALSVKGATHSFFAEVFSSATQSYLTP